MDLCFRQGCTSCFGAIQEENNFTYFHYRLLLQQADLKHKLGKIKGLPLYLLYIANFGKGSLLSAFTTFEYKKAWNNSYGARNGVLL
jgi:hypothetical protein